MELTSRIIKLFDMIQKNISGRFAMWPQDAAAWYDLNYQSSGNTLEIGTAWGGSAVLARYAKDDAGKQDTIYTIDPLGGFYGRGKPDIMAGSFPTVEVVERNFTYFNASNIQLVLAMTPPIPKELNGLMFSCVLIDGNHNDNGPLDDWNCVKNRVNPGGFVMCHDIHKDAVAKMITKAEKEPGWKLVTRYMVKGRGMPSQSQVKGNENFGSHAIFQRL
jgi:hypothetical protein